jgi:hypothetical protein
MTGDHVAASQCICRWENGDPRSPNSMVNLFGKFGGGGWGGGPLEAKTSSVGGVSYDQGLQLPTGHCFGWLKPMPSCPYFAM